MRAGSRPRPPSAAATSSTLYLAKKAGVSPLTRMLSACWCWYSAPNLSNSASSMVYRPGADNLAGMPARVRKRCECTVGGDLVHDEKQPPLGLDIHAAEILAEDAEGEQLRAAEDKNDRRESRPPVVHLADRPGEQRIDQHGDAL